MKSIIKNLIVVTALSFSSAALAAGEMESKAQPPAAQPMVSASAVPPATAAESTSPAPKSKPGAKRSTSGKRAKAKTVRPKDLDLRHCLKLETNVAIARCARE